MEISSVVASDFCYITKLPTEILTCICRELTEVRDIFAFEHTCTVLKDRVTACFVPLRSKLHIWNDIPFYSFEDHYLKADPLTSWNIGDLECWLARHFCNIDTLEIEFPKGICKRKREVSNASNTDLFSYSFQNVRKVENFKAQMRRLLAMITPDNFPHLQYINVWVEWTDKSQRQRMVSLVDEHSLSLPLPPDQFYRHFSRFPHLKSLHMPYFGRSPDCGLSCVLFLRTQCASLAQIDLTMPYASVKRAVQSFIADLDMPHVHTFIVRDREDVGASEDTLDLPFSAKKPMPNLRWFQVQLRSRIKLGKGVDQIDKACPNLETLRLAGNYYYCFNDGDQIKALARLPKLVDLAMTVGPNNGAAVVADVFREIGPNLQMLRIGLHGAHQWSGREPARLIFSLQANPRMEYLCIQSALIKDSHARHARGLDDI